MDISKLKIGIILKNKNIIGVSLLNNLEKTKAREFAPKELENILQEKKLFIKKDGVFKKLEIIEIEVVNSISDSKSFYFKVTDDSIQGIEVNDLIDVVTLTNSCP